ncbi:SGNH/GDSL hydrolase family protein [Kutzneria sp. CA-103260]|uniref:SGNH/GDSL hydrolase family protein n=1 Tax=Kutzneria sp. CA-103260 TaxID=2802641 RepID=UPI001BA60DC9|nr:SGNH/GDSL hydrolase family protein [Kutzneria sp. CA-103260]QUQ67845.1 GDSL family lipase [Kutzneria sp. CA-103260]
MTRLLVAALATLAAVATAPAAFASIGPLHVVAMGDSYASGTGAGDYEAGTEGNCWRSANSYSEQVVARLRARGTSVQFTNVACSGAATSDLHQEFLGQPPQLDALQVDTAIVLLTIGTNDIGYAAYGGLCIQGDCSGAPTQAITAELPDMAKNLAQLFRDIHDRSPHAKIVLTGYGSQLTAGPNADGQLDPICDAGVFSPQERAQGNVLASQLDKTLRDTTAQAGPDTGYVSEYAADSTHLVDAFAGHSLCQAGTPFYRGFDALTPGQEGPDAVLHLNKDGQSALADLVLSQV